MTELYFERLTPELKLPWECGWPVDCRGDDEVAEQRQHDLVFETRPRRRHPNWWQFAHQVAELAYSVGVPGPISLQTDIALPVGSALPEDLRGKLVLHNDPSISSEKAWPWEQVQRLVTCLTPRQVILVGHAGPSVDGCIDLRDQTTLAQAAALIAASSCYIGIDSGLMWIAGSLQFPTVGLYGTSYIPAYQAIHPANPNAVYLQAEGPLSNIPVEAVLEAVAWQLKRSLTGE